MITTKETLPKDGRVGIAHRSRSHRDRVGSAHPTNSVQGAFRCRVSCPSPTKSGAGMWTRSHGGAALGHGTHRFGCRGAFDIRNRGIALVLTIVLALMWTPAVAAAQKPAPPNPSKRDSDLSRKLIDKAASDADEDVMATIMRIMRDVAQRLEIKFDPGEETQGAQHRIVEKLDEAIKIAAAQRRPTRSRSQSKSADKRRMPKPRAGETSHSKDARARAADDTTNSRRTKAVKPGAATGARGDLPETRRTWGNLPMRDREEIIQGVGEQFLERYRAWIERYYRALQESDE